MRLRVLHLWLLFVLLHVARPTNESSSSLLLIQVVHRHGARTPLHRFPLDPYKDIYEYRKGELTVVGARQLFRLGSYLRDAYVDVLPVGFDNQFYYIRSTNTERTIASAESLLAGLFFKADHAKEHISPEMPWYPHAIHTKPRYLDEMSPNKLDCAKKNNTLKRLKTDINGKWKTLERDMKDLLISLEKPTGLNQVTISDASSLYGMLQCWSAMNLARPSWLDDNIVKKVRSIHDFKYAHFYKDPLFGVSAFRVLLDAMHSRLNGTNHHILESYSGHDDTVGSLLHFVGAFNGKSPPYAAALIFELYSNATVRLLYRNETDQQVSQVYHLSMSCGQWCPVTQLSRLHEQLQSVSFDVMCQQSIFNTVAQVISPLHLLWIVLTIILTLSLLATLTLLYLNRRFLVVLPSWNGLTRYNDYKLVNQKPSSRLRGQRHLA